MDVATSIIEECFAVARASGIDLRGAATDRITATLTEEGSAKLQEEMDQKKMKVMMKSWKYQTIGKL